MQGKGTQRVPFSFYGSRPVSGMESGSVIYAESFNAVSASRLPSAMHNFFSSSETG